eukprot:COSAG03_NODE_480_length_7581_cov_8.105052_2_plen_137_part_00
MTRAEWMDCWASPWVSLCCCRRRAGFEPIPSCTTPAASREQQMGASGSSDAARAQPEAEALAEEAVPPAAPLTAAGACDAAPGDPPAGRISYRIGPLQNSEGSRGKFIVDLQDGDFELSPDVLELAIRSVQVCHSF